MTRHVIEREALADFAFSHVVAACADSSSFKRLYVIVTPATHSMRFEVTSDRAPPFATDSLSDAILEYNDR